MVAKRRTRVFRHTRRDVIRPTTLSRLVFEYRQMLREGKKPSPGFLEVFQDKLQETIPSFAHFMKEADAAARYNTRRGKYDALPRPTIVIVSPKIAMEKGEASNRFLATLSKGEIHWESWQSERPTSVDECSWLLPTPTASRYGTTNNGDPGDNRGRYRTKGKRSLNGLAKQGLLPTPMTRGGNYHKKTHRAGNGLATVVGGPLNPRFLEWLMGYPDEWTDNER